MSSASNDDGAHGLVSRISEVSAKNRFFVLALIACLVAGGLYAMRRVQLDAIPDLSDPQVIVFSEWMGRSPTLVEDQITYPIVSALVAAPKVTDVRGFSMFGMSFVYVIFEEGTDVYWARSRVLEYLSALRDRLPPSVAPVLGPDATGVGWVFQYVLVDKSGERNLADLRGLQDFTLRYALASVDGVAEVASVGGYEKQYQVTVDPNRLRAYELTLEDVARVIRESNADVGGRSIEMSGREYFVRGRGYISSLEQIERLTLRARGASGTPVLVRDVADVRFGPDLRRGLLEWNGQGEAVGGIVVMRYGENARDVIARVKQKLEELRPSFPPGVEVQIAYDRSSLIDRAIDTLKSALFEEGLVVSLVIILFLLHLRSALLPILSIPVSVVLAFIPMFFFGIPSTIMSLGGIAIAIGASVDAEIVMIEAAHKKLEHNPPPEARKRLLAEATREVTPAIFFSLLIIAVSFLPVFGLNGQAGRLFKPLAFTKTFVMLGSALLSITFAPALRDLLLRGKFRKETEHPVSRAIRRVYEPFVFVALRNPRSTLLIGLLAIASAVPIGLRLGHEFMPPLNEGDMLYMPTTLPNISIEEAKRQVQRQDRVIISIPEVRTVFGKVGRAETPTDPAPLSMVETTIQLKPQSEWRLMPRQRWYSGFAPEWLKVALRPLWPEKTRITWDELAVELNRATQFPGWTAAFTMPIKTRIDMLTTGVRTPLGIKVLGADLQEIERVGIALERIIGEVPGTRSVIYERALGGAYVDIVPRLDALARYGLNPGDVLMTVEAAIGGAEVSTTVEGRARYSINVRYSQDFRGDVEGLRSVLIPLQANGAMQRPAMARPNDGGMASAMPMSMQGAEASFVPLGQVADVRIVSGPPMIRDDDGALVGYVYIDIDQRERDIGGYVDDAKAAVARARTDGSLSTTAFLKWTGQYELLAQMRQRMKVLIPLALVIICVLLYLQFRNIFSVLIVLMSVPFALTGSIWLLWALDYRLSTAVWVGVIALVGLAAQTGVVMIVYIDQAFERRRRAGKVRDLNDIIWAHMEGTVMRVRPKLMTVGTMLFGLVPLLWATGSGADVMKRVAAPMVGGLLTSAFLTLEIIPVIYTYWRYEELMLERVERSDPGDHKLLARLKTSALCFGLAWLAGMALAVSRIYVELPPGLFIALVIATALVMVASAASYLLARPRAKRRAWPEGSLTAVTQEDLS
ncbi:MAG: efflux RND transporter permease subunit [Deltaproteobacteria bacterium]|nr:efflux RND transporter permease subunit [Deltaproteobacteria bacterium]